MNPSSARRARHQPPRARRRATPRLQLGLSILAGGQSQRMGRDKARLRLRGKSLLARVKAVATAMGWPVRVIRRDQWPGLGPVGGVHAALATARNGTDAELFLACDMPFVSLDLLRYISARLGRKLAVFAAVKAVPGFPFIVRTAALPVVEAQLRSGKLSLHELARALGARLTPVPTRLRPALANLNTPEEWSRAQAQARGGV